MAEVEKWEMKQPGRTKEAVAAAAAEVAEAARLQDAASAVAPVEIAEAACLMDAAAAVAEVARLKESLAEAEKAAADAAKARE